VNPCAPAISLPSFNKDAIWGALARKVGSKVQLASAKKQVVGSKFALKSALKQTKFQKFNSLTPSTQCCPAPPCANPCAPIAGPGPVAAPEPVETPLEGPAPFTAETVAEPTPV
jgi:hypothetical protein